MTAAHRTPSGGDTFKNMPPSDGVRNPSDKNIEIEIKKAAFGGDGVGTLNGKTCFVEGALPGETVIARVTQDKKNFIKAKLVKVLERSPFRDEPPCPYVDRCGGCQYQHVDYDEELRIKESQLREMVERTLGADPTLVEPIVYADKPYGYRNSVTLHRSSADCAKPQRLGFITRDNETTIVVDNCLLVDERLSEVFLAKRVLGKEIERATFKLSDKGELVSDRDAFFYRVRLGDETFLSSSRGFFQNNLAVASLLAAKVREWTEAVRPRVFFDLYAGVGTFSFLSAKCAHEVHCIEENIDSLEALRMNASERGMKQVRATQGRVEKVFPRLFSTQVFESAMVCLDPPRQGIDGELAEFLRDTEGLEAIVYVSCDPATLMRDLRVILSSGKRILKQVVPFDMFPRTKHIEVAALIV